MSSGVPAGMGGFFPGMLGDLLKMLRTDAPFPYELSLQLAQSVTTGAGGESNVDPLDRIRIEQLTRLAELQVADVTGMTTTPSGRPMAVVATTRPEWANRSLGQWRGLLENIASALVPKAEPAAPASDDTEDDEEVAAAFFAKWATAVAPAMVAMQFGSLVGHLACRTLGQYELPLPLGGPEIAVVPANEAEFASDWSLPGDDVTLLLRVRDVTTHAVLSRPHVARRLEELLVEHAKGFHPDPSALEAKMNDAALSGSTDVDGLMRLFGDPSALGELVDTPDLLRTRAELRALGATLAGYIEWVVDTVAVRATASGPSMHEAMRRRRVESNDDERSADALFGLLTGQQAVDLGQKFVHGILDRGGGADLAKLWVVEANLPTPAELDAPGLWMERVNLPELDEPPGH